jgi:two-component system cell cycle sensor histidine kinase/response regulator CckA
MMPSADRRYRVLIVDDEEPVLRFVDKALRQAGYETMTASSGPAALAVTETDTALDLLLTDLMMPGMGGDELAQILHERMPGVKVLYLTGFSDRLFAVRPMLWANEAFVDKPVSATGLHEAVSLLLFGHTRGLANAAADDRPRPN